MQLSVNFPNMTLLPIRLAIKSLGYRMGERLKRTIFVFTVMAAVDRIHGTDDKIIEEVNGKMKIAYNADVCKAAARTRDSVWQTSPNHISIEDMPTMVCPITVFDREKLADYYVENCPDWLRYGDPSGTDMRRDIRNLLSSIPLNLH